MNKRYLFFCSLAYAYPILRPLQQEIRRRGDEAAWFLEAECPDLLEPDEIRLRTWQEVKAYNPVAVFAPGNRVYDFFPGVKVSVFHGYPINKRADKVDDHFKLRGYFDIYCTQGPSSTLPFQELERQHGYFKVYETGWCKTDSFVTPEIRQMHREKQTPTVFVATTFSPGISSLHLFLPEIRRMAATRPWRWVITRHPKLNDPVLLEQYRQLAAECDNVEFLPNTTVTDMARTDVMLCDSSSIIIEYMLLDKPVVTLNNTLPGPHLLNVANPANIEAALEQAFTRPESLMTALRSYAHHHEAHCDGQNCARILDAVDDFIRNHQSHLKRKPLNLFRKLKARWKFFRQ